MAILTIGMVGLVGIIPVSTEALTYANGKLYAAEIAQSMADFVDADVNGMTASPTTFSATVDSYYQTNTSSTVVVPIPTAIADTCTSPVVTGHLLLGNVSQVESVDNAPYRNKPVHLASAGFFKVVRQTTLTDSSLTDFSAAVWVWFDATPAPAASTNALVNVEVTWPSNQTIAANRAAGRTLTIQRFIRVH